MIRECVNYTFSPTFLRSSVTAAQQNKIMTAKVSRKQNRKLLCKDVTVWAF